MLQLEHGDETLKMMKTRTTCACSDGGTLLLNSFSSREEDNFLIPLPSEAKLAQELPPHDDDDDDKYISCPGRPSAAVEKTL